jgi:Bacteriophage head to tail connecting protein
MAHDTISKVGRKEQRLEQLKQKKRPFERMFELVARYIDMRVVSFTDEGKSTFVQVIPEDVINNDVSHIADTAASALFGALWPNGANSFRINKHRSILDSQVIKTFFKSIVNPVMLDTMDNPENGLLLALEEAIAEYMNYGVTSINVKENEDSQSKPVSFTCWDVKGNYIDENEDKFIDTVYRQRTMDVRTLVSEYGYENVSAAVKRMFDSYLYDEKVNVIITIEPRDKRKQITPGNMGMPIETLHYEKDTLKVLREGGFPEFPTPTARYKKKPDEVWGRGSGGQALPEVIEIQAIWEAITIAYEQFLDPAIGVLDDGRLGGNDIDTSAGGINVFNVDTLTGGSNPVFPIFQNAEPSGALLLAQQLTQSISQHYMLDRLLDLNNQTEMTLGEANIRDRLRSDSLRRVYARITAELFIPIINRTFNILFRRGMFGVMPGSEQELEFILSGKDYEYLPDEIINAIIQNKDFYDIEFISPAARMLQTEEANGITSILSLSVELSAAVPTILDQFNIDDMVKRLASILGVSVDVINSTEVVQGIRQQRAEFQAQAAEVEQAKEVSEINRNNAQAQAQTQAQANNQGIVQ